MKTISILLLLGLVQTGLAQTVLVPVQPRKVVLAVPLAKYSSFFLESVSDRQEELDLSVSGCGGVSVVYYIDGKKIRGNGKPPVLNPRQIQVITGGLLAEYAPTPASENPFYPTLSQGRYAYH